MRCTLQVRVFNLTAQMNQIEGDKQPGRPDARAVPAKPLESHSHGKEGYALAWSPASEGCLAAGDNNKRLYVW